MTNRNRRLLAASVLAVFLGLATIALTACESAPIQVTPVPDVAAVTRQNSITKKHIANTRQHISKSQDEQVKTDASLESAKKDLDDLIEDGKK